VTAREAILERLGGMLEPAAITAEALALLEAPERPQVAAEAHIERFVAQLALPSVAATLERLRTWSDVPAAVAAYLEANALPPALYLSPDPQLMACDWSGLALHERCAPDEPAAITRSRAAVAETGSLIFETAPGSPMLPNFLTLHHLVVVEESTIVAQLEDIPGKLTAARAHYWVTGVSGTTDIEGQYVRGAHGPRFLHVLLVG
jgi:L-lactate dehydrogenase complex protein LldG